MRKSRNVLLALILATFAAPSPAATTNTSFNVNATVIATCTVSASDLQFGAGITVPTVNVDVNTTLTANCVSGTPYTVALNVGNGSGATFAVRKMTFGANTLNYSLFTDAGRTTSWGDGTGGSSTVAGTGSGANQSLTVFGRIFSGQTIPFGTYADLIQVTLTF